ncbi:MAG: hypothetical protein LQ338_006443 [Usnochroma carphineum]|nr:MAG: hypothetical protein LQ338_006443 [Usnochroma carphineum]
MSDTEATQAPSPPVVPPQGMAGPIVLQVGEGRFHASESTLSESPVLKAMIAERWESSKQPDGSYFLDADPEVFKHVLRFLRHGVYPLCYNIAKGHDFAMYTAIHKQADYLMLDTLAEWLSKRLYLQAITVETSAHVVEDEDGLSGKHDSDTLVQYHPFWRTKKKYVCPRGIAVHYDNPGRCGRACQQAQGDAGDEYEDCPVLSTLVLTKKVAFDQQLCEKE